MAASPWTVRRSWWRSVGIVQVVVGSMIEWRRMAWSRGVISSHRSEPIPAVGPETRCGPGWCVVVGGAPLW